MKSRSPFAWISRLAHESPWIVMAVAVHAIVIALAAVYYTSGHEEKADDAPLRLARAAPRPVDELPIPPEPQFVRNAVPPQKEDELTPVEPVYHPDDPTTVTLVEVAGDPNELPSDSHLAPGGDAVGVGNRGTRGFATSPLGTRFKGPGGGGEPGREKPKTFEYEGVLNGLTWLARHQNPDGSWSATTLHERCTSEPGCGDPKVHYDASYDEGLTGLALLAFLGAGYSHEHEARMKDPVTGREYKVGDVVKSGLKWLVARQQPSGAIAQSRVFVYSHALATMALAEAYGLTQQRYFKEPAQRAVDYLVAAQRPGPTGGKWGWRYAPRQDIEEFHRGDTVDADFLRELHDSDTSVTGWCAMALKSAALAGLSVPADAMEGALAFTRWTSTADGQVGYLDPKSAGATVTGPGDQYTYHPASMSALGMCIRIFTAHDPNDAFLPLAAARVAGDLPKVTPDKLSVDYYYWYYGSLALNQFDGPDSPTRTGRYWEKWNKATLAALQATVDGNAKRCSHGGWVQPDRWSRSGGPIYATAINVLTLEVYYRYPNAFGVVGHKPRAIK